MNITVIKGDITTVRTDAIVNAANVKLRGGGGVDGAIHQAAGPELLHFEKYMYPFGLTGGIGSAVVTPAYALPAKWVIHTAGPDVRGFIDPQGYSATTLRDLWTQADEDLWGAYARSLTLAALMGAKTVTFPSISTGIFAFPLERAVPIALEAMNVNEPLVETIDTVSFVAFDEETYQAFKRAL